MDPHKRQRMLQLFCQTHDILLARNIESALHAHSSSSSDYMDNGIRVAFNMYSNPTIASPDMVFLNDRDLIHGTLLEQIEHETKLRNERFEKMLQEKYEQIDEEGYTGVLRCRRCGRSDNVSYDEKQTRGSDESMTLFCNCGNCGNRWVIR